MNKRIFANLKFLNFVIIAIAYLTLSCSNNDQEKLNILIKGNEAMAAGDYDEAIDYFDRALQLDPDFADAYNNMGVAFFENDEPGMALENYNRAIRLKPDYYEAIMNRSNAFSELGRVESALADLEVIRQAFPDTSIVHFARGLVLTKAKDYNRAIGAFNMAGQIDQSNVEVPVNIGTIHYYQKNFDSAKYFLDIALKIDPTQGSAYNTLALIAMDEMNSSLALELINKALDQAPDDPYFLNNRGFIYLQMDSLARGEADINESIRIDPFNGWAYRNRAILRLKQEQFEAALGLLKRAIYEDTEVDLVYYYLGEAYFKTGDILGACEAWKVSISKGDLVSKDRIDKHCSGA